MIDSNLFAEIKQIQEDMEVSINAIHIKKYESQIEENIKIGEVYNEVL